MLTARGARVGDARGDARSPARDAPRNRARRAGDVDLVVGASDGELYYFENIGSRKAPAFEERTGSASPFFGIEVGESSIPFLVDLDLHGELRPRPRVMPSCTAVAARKANSRACRGRPLGA